MSFRRFVALGDSFTEGVGDPDPSLPNGVRGWADRMAEVLARQTDQFQYANLAIRGRKMEPILTEQVEPAVTMQPDLVTIYAGGNDVLRPKVDLDAMMQRYSDGVGQLAETGAHIALFTPFDPVSFPIFDKLRGRFAVYTEYVREIADKYGATIVDCWRLRDEYVDARMWDVDRLHMSTFGHQRMAILVLDTLGIEHDLVMPPLPVAAQLSVSERRAQNLQWAREYAGPWVKRRLTGASSGDSMSPRWPQLASL